MDNNINTLINELNDISRPLNESADNYSKLNLGITSALISVLNTTGITKAELSDRTKMLLKAVQGINTGDIKVIAYPGINEQKNYSVNASVYMNYIVKNIMIDAKLNESKIDKDELLGEALAIVCKDLTGDCDKRSIDMDEFRLAYRLYVFGSLKKIQLRPNIPRLTSLALKVPMVISYINRTLMNRQMRTLTDYEKTVSDDLYRLAKSNPEILDRVNTYASILRTSVYTIMRIYQCIKNAYVDLQHEYDCVFTQILRESKCNESISIDNSSYDVLNESSTDIRDQLKVVMNNIDNKLACSKKNKAKISDMLSWISSNITSTEIPELVDLVDISYYKNITLDNINKENIRHDSIDYKSDIKTYVYKILSIDNDIKTYVNYKQYVNSIDDICEIVSELLDITDIIFEKYDALLTYLKSVYNSAYAIEDIEQLNINQSIQYATFILVSLVYTLEKLTVSLKRSVYVMYTGLRDSISNV